MTSPDLQLVGGYPVDQWAASLNVNPRTLYRAIERGDLRCYRIGRAIRVTRDQIIDFLEGEHE